MFNTKLIFLALISSLILTSCNTVSGFGKDMKAGGQKLERKAERNKGEDSKQ